MRTKVNVAAEVAAIATLSREELAARWERAYGLQPTGGIRTDLLARSAAWHFQAKHLGGFTAETRRLLKSAMGNLEAGLVDRNKQGLLVHMAPRDFDELEAKDEATNPVSPKPQRRKLEAGARLMRDWNGRTHVVDVVHGGYVFEARIYKSLTAIAELITGAHWSGPRFFGL